MVEGLVLRKQSVSDGMGGYEDKWVYQYSIDGYLDQMSANEVLASEKLGQTSDYVFICFDPTIDLTRYDQINVGGTIETDNTVTGGDNYAVRDVDNPLHMGHHLEITLRYTE